MEAVAQCVPSDLSDVEGMAALAVKTKADLVVVGPEGPLATSPPSVGPGPKCGGSKASI